MAAFLKRYAKSKLSEERARIEPFLSSTLDGIDLRETIRNWHEGKLYVRELGKFSGEVGALVIIFDEDRNDRYQLSHHLARRTSERVRHGVLFHPSLRPS